MKISRLSIVFLCFALLAAVPAKLNYQGRITDGDGIGVNETLDMTFNLHDVGGALLWSEDHTDVAVEKGLFSVILGSVTPIDLSFDAQYFLEIVVDGDAMTPYVPLNAEAYAMRAAIADSVKGGMGVTSIEGLAGAITLTGGDGITITNVDNDIQIEFSGTVPGDDWGEQIAYTDGTLSGDGTILNPLKIGWQYALTGDVLIWNGSTWYPGSVSGSASQNLQQTLEIGNNAGYYDIDMNGNDLLNVSTIYVDLIEPDGLSYVRVGDDLYPSSGSSFDLGSSSYSWNDLYLRGKLYVDGYATANKVLGTDGSGYLEWKDEASGGSSEWYDAGSYLRPQESGEDVVPYGTATLGTSSYRWDIVYADDGDFYGDLSAASLDLGYSGDITCDEIDCDALYVNLSSRSSGNTVLEYYDRLYYQSSSRKYKEDITPFREDFKKLLQLEPKSYICKTGRDRNIGFIAEELDSIGLYPLVNYAFDGTPNSIPYNMLPIYMVPILKDHEDRLVDMPISDFGTVVMDQEKMFVQFSDDFSNILGNEKPVITLTTNSFDARVIVAEKSHEGFTVICDKLIPGLAFDWTAMAHVQKSSNPMESEVPASRDDYQREWKKGLFAVPPSE